MDSHNTKLNKRVTFLLVSLALLAYFTKSFAEPASFYMSFANSLVTMINLSILFSSNGFEKIFHNNIYKFITAFICGFLVFMFICNIFPPQWADIILNFISWFSIAGTFIQNNKNNIYFS